MKRCTVAIVSVSTALPAVAPAIPAFADEEDGAVTGEGKDAATQDASVEAHAGQADEASAAREAGEAAGETADTDD